MDYCHPCRRHLNGALACPGCGTPADAVRAYAEALAAQEGADEPQAPPESEPGPRSRRRPRTAHRRRRRRVLLATAALALAAGGLGLAELGTESAGSADRRAAPDATEELADSDPASPATVDPDPSTAPDASSAAASRPASATPSRTESSPSARPTKKDTPVNSASPTATSPQASPTTAQPTSSAPRPTETSQAPEPSPSHTCDRFLWWCT
ncbi:hypothetical protein [Streptomyces sp. NPDC052225]|uniref:SCO2400 family protein n=1 Tax=Streptomyces sp. NPDC052225 TaxID=3154949 RepID=UPI00342E5AE9